MKIYQIDIEGATFEEVIDQAKLDENAHLVEGVPWNFLFNEEFSPQKLIIFNDGSFLIIDKPNKEQEL